MQTNHLTTENKTENQLDQEVLLESIRKSEERINEIESRILYNDKYKPLYHLFCLIANCCVLWFLILYAIFNF